VVSGIGGASMTAHRVYGSDEGSCRYLILQGVGEYDNVAVGG
jgi:hypothetical protein